MTEMAALETERDEQAALIAGQRTELAVLRPIVEGVAHLPDSISVFGREIAFCWFCGWSGHGPSCPVLAARAWQAKGQGQP